MVKRWLISRSSIISGLRSRLSAGVRAIRRWRGRQLSGNDTERALLATRTLIHPPAALRDFGPLGVGIAQGIMRTGAYGRVNRRTYGVLGSAVNPAAHLMHHAAPQQILRKPRAR